MKKQISYELDTIGKMTEQLVKMVGMTTAAINREYKIKVHGQGLNTLVGVSGLLALVGVERAAKMLTRANACAGDVCRCRVYGQDTQVSFYIH